MSNQFPPPRALALALVLMVVATAIPIVNAGNGTNCPGTLTITSQPSSGTTSAATLSILVQYQGNGPGFISNQCDIGWITTCTLLVNGNSHPSTCPRTPSDAQGNCSVNTCYVSLSASYTFPADGNYNFAATVGMTWGCCLWQGGPQSTATATWTTTSLRTPSTPQNPAAMSGSARGEISLFWQSPASSGGSSISSYEVYRSTSASGTYTHVASPTTTAWTDTGQPEGQTRHYRVAASNNAGEGPQSLTASAVPCCQPCSIQSIPLTALSHSEILPNAWTRHTTSPGVGWQAFMTPARAATGEPAGHINPLRLWYTSDNLTQPNYVAGSDGQSPNSGTATSPALSTSAAPQLYFSSRHEIEARDPADHDSMRVEISDNNGPWRFVCTINPPTATWGLPDESVCSDGTITGAYPCPADGAGSTTPQWETRTVTLPTLGDSFRIRFSFNTVDGLHNDHLGWMVTDIRIVGELE